MYKLPERGGGGGGGIRAMPERKHSFLKEVFPYRPRLQFNYFIQTHKQHLLAATPVPKSLSHSIPLVKGKVFLILQFMFALTSPVTGQESQE